MAGFTGNDLNVFLVRLRFVFFADDTGAWEKGLFSEFLETRRAEDGSDLGPLIERAFRVLDTAAVEGEACCQEDHRPRDERASSLGSRAAAVSQIRTSCSPAGCPASLASAAAPGSRVRVQGVISMLYQDLQGKTAVITGAGHAQGQGAASARMLASLGMRVLVTDRHADLAAECAEGIVSAGGVASSMRVDVRDEAQVSAMVAHAVSTYGRLDVLHSQAADLEILADPGDPDITQVTVEMWREQFETIALGAFLTCKHAIPAMVENGGGSIICTTSISSLMGEPNLTVYGSAKAAVNQLVRSVSAQWGKRGIRCNAIAPGLILSAPGLAIGPDLIDQYARHCSTGEAGTPEDVAHLVAYLASSASKYMSGQVVQLDGGFTSHSPMLAEQQSTGLIVGV
ncbi:MAG: SDR family oxidoreductase [Actinobacteria bacterium]|uniref:Unannotated protein n=1 Tax=freshwater metagenome TaxID=449393 RepID=A0A6J7RY54_9ZZZZ|nr:SDR family oxidoreductase [Actinomycetota bacterium]